MPTRTLSPDNDYYSHRRDRSRSPVGRIRRRYADFDDPQIRDEEEQFYRRRLRDDEDGQYGQGMTMADRMQQQQSLQGSKVVVKNLAGSVTEDDIKELFGDIGQLKRSKLFADGTAEVFYVNKADASKAIEVYHNRQLDGKAMNCTIPGAILSSPRLSARVKEDRDGGRGERLHPELQSVHKALFNPAASSSGRPSSSRAPRGDKPMFTAMRSSRR